MINTLYVYLLFFELAYISVRWD